MLNKNSEKVIKQVFKHFVGLIEKNKIVNGTVELLGERLALSADNPILEFGDIRPFNYTYARNEIKWYESQDLCIKGHSGIENNKIWQSIATKDGFVNSNYGYCCFNKRGLKKSQFEYALENLIPTGGNSGRQSVIYYAGPKMQEWSNDGVHASHDFTCTLSTQHFVRNNKLEYFVNQRSCDSIFGLTFDFYHHCYVYQAFLAELHVTNPEICEGKIVFNFGSLHLYQRHFDLVKKIVEAYDKGEL